MSSIQRLSAEEVRRRVQNGVALLICAYEDEEKFRNNRLEGALSMAAFRERVPSLSRDQEIVFYCA